MANPPHQHLSLEDAVRARLPCLVPALHDPMHDVAAGIERLASQPGGGGDDVLEAVCPTTTTTGGGGVAFFGGDPLGHAPRPVSARTFLREQQEGDEVLYVSQQPLLPGGRLGLGAAAARPPRELLPLLPPPSPSPPGGDAAAAAAAAARCRPHLWLSAPCGPPVLSSVHFDDEDNLLCVLGRAPDSEQKQQQQQERQRQQKRQKTGAPPPQPRPLGTGAKLAVLWPPECGPLLLPHAPAGEWANHSRLDSARLLGRGLFSRLVPADGAAGPGGRRYDIDAEEGHYTARTLFRELALPLALRFVVRPGQALFIPAGWWHAVLSEPGCVAVSYWWRPHQGSEPGGNDGGDDDDEAAAPPPAPPAPSCRWARLRQALADEAMAIAEAAVAAVAHELREEDEAEGRRSAAALHPDTPQPEIECPSERDGGGSGSGSGSGSGARLCLAPAAAWAERRRPRARGRLCLALVRREGGGLCRGKHVGRASRRVPRDSLRSVCAAASAPRGKDAPAALAAALRPAPEAERPPPPPPQQHQPPPEDQPLGADEVASLLRAARSCPFVGFALTKILDQGDEGARLGARIWEAAGRGFRAERRARRIEARGGGGGGSDDDADSGPSEETLERLAMQKQFGGVMSQRCWMLEMASRAAAAGAGAARF